MPQSQCLDWSLLRLSIAACRSDTDVNVVKCAEAFEGREHGADASDHVGSPNMIVWDISQYKQFCPDLFSWLLLAMIWDDSSYIPLQASFFGEPIMKSNHRWLKIAWCTKHFLDRYHARVAVSWYYGFLTEHVSEKTIWHCAKKSVVVRWHIDETCGKQANAQRVSIGISGHHVSNTQISVETCIMRTGSKSHHALPTRATLIYEERDSMHLTNIRCQEITP